MKLTQIKNNFFRHFVYGQQFSLEIEEEMEKLIGLRVSEIEKTLLNQKNSPKPENSYIENLESSALNTTFFDWITILNSLDENDVLLDLGSGYSKASILNSILDLNKNIYSIEFIKERVDETKKVLTSLNLKSDKVLHDDFLKSECLKLANKYFIYLPYDNLLEDLLDRLFYESKQRKIKIMAIESHGDLIGKLLNVPWLRLVDKTKLKAQRHDPYLYTFESTEYKEAESLYLELVKRRNNFLVEDQLLFEDEKGEWIADAKDFFLCHLDHSEVFIETNIPKRRVSINSLKKIIRVSDPQILELIRLRKERNWKKIYLMPEIIVENSSGFRKNLAQILKDN